MIYTNDCCCNLFSSLCLEYKECLREAALKKVEEEDPLGLVGDGRRKTFASNHVPTAAFVLQHGVHVES